MRRWILALVCAAVAPLAWGQGTAGSVELTPFAGYVFGDTLTRGTTGAFDYDVTIDDAPVYGLRVAYRFSPHWALETSFAGVNADLVTTSGDLFGGENRLGGIDVMTGSVGIEGSFGRGRLVGFFSGGVGATRLDPNVTGLSSETRFSGNIGGGFKLFLSRQVAMRFDLRGHSVNLDSGRGSCEWDHHCYHDCYCDPRGEWITLTELSLGLTFVL